MLRVFSHIIWVHLSAVSYFWVHTQRAEPMTYDLAIMVLEFLYIIKCINTPRQYTILLYVFRDSSEQQDGLTLFFSFLGGIIFSISLYCCFLRLSINKRGWRSCSKSLGQVKSFTHSVTYNIYFLTRALTEAEKGRRDNKW